MTQPSYNQDNYRFYSDDANEATATALGTGNNQALDMDTGTSNRVQVRVELHNTNSKAGVLPFSFEYNVDTTGWNTLNDASDVRLYSSSYNTHDEDTTQRLSSSTPYDTTNGGCINTVTDPATNSNLDADVYVEIVATIYLVTGQFSGSENIQLRIVTGQTVTYTNYPTINVVAQGVDVTPSPVNAIASSVNPTVVKGSVTVTPAAVGTICNKVDPTVAIGFTGLSQVNWRFRDDTAALNTDSGWLADLNVAPSSIDMGTPFRIRIEIEENQSVSETHSYKLQYRIGAGAWDDVDIHMNDNHTAVIADYSNNFADNDATTNLLSGSSEAFTAGHALEGDNLTTSGSLLDQHTEFEWALMLMRRYDAPTNFGELADSSTIELRVVESDGTLLDGYRTISFTANYPSGLIGGCFIESPQSCGPIKDDNGNLYFIMEHTSGAGGIGNTPIMVKSTDNGVTWSEVDGSNRPSSTYSDFESGDIQVVDDTIHIFQHKGASIYYHTFNMSSASSNPDTWQTKGQAITTGITCSDQAVAGVVLSDGDAWCFYRETVSSYERISYKRRTTGSWGSANNLDSEASTNFTWVTCVRGASDLTHIFYQEITNGTGNMYHRSLSSGGTLSGREAISTNSGTVNNHSKGIAKPIYYDSSGDEVIFVVYREQSNSTYSRTVTNDGSPSSATAATDNGVNRAEGGSNMASMQLVGDGTGNAYLIYSDITSEDLYLAFYEGGSWGTDVEVLDNSTIDFQQIGWWVTSSGVVTLGYIYETDDAALRDTGPMWYGSYILGLQISNTTPAGAIASSIDPTVQITGGDETVEPSPVSCIASSVNPTTVLGSITLTPSATNSISSSVNPTVVIGDTTVTPAAVTAIADVALPIKYLEDTFNDNSIDSILWSEGSANTTSDDPLVTVTETGQQLEIQPRDSVTGSHMNGVYTNHVYDMTSTSVYVRLVQASTPGGGNVFNILTVQNFPRNEQNCIGIWTNGNGNIEFGYRQTAGGWDYTSISYNSSTMKWVRIAHSGSNILWQTSSDGITWTTRRTVALSNIEIDLSNVHVHIWGGTWASSSSPTASIADNLNIIPSVTVTPIGPSAIGSTVDPTVVLGDTTATPAAVNAVASSVDPTVVLGSTTATPTPVNAIARNALPISYLMDSFGDASMGNQWLEGSGAVANDDPLVTVTESGGTVTISPRDSQSGNHYNGYYSKQRYDLTNSELIIEWLEIVDATSSSATSDVSIQSGLRDSRRIAMFGVDSFTTNNFGPVYRNSTGGWTEIISKIPWSSTNHRWLKFKHNGANIEFYTSSNGSNWSLLASEAISNIEIDITDVMVGFSAGTWSSTTVTQDPIFDNVNTLSPITPSPASAIASKVDPTVLAGGDVTVEPSAVTSVSSSVAPTVVLGSTTATPSAVNTISSSVAPTVVLGSVTVTPTPVSAIVQSVLPAKYCADNFDDNSIDTNLWAMGGANSAIDDASVTTSETSQTLRIQPLDSTSGSHYYGVYSKQVYSLENNGVAVEVEQVSASGASTVVNTNFMVQEFPRDSQLSLAIYTEGDNNILFAYKQAAGGFDTTQLTYNATNHRWWRIAHDGTNVLWQTSPDGFGWTTQRSVLASTLDIDLTNVHVQIYGGSWDSVSSPSVQIWNNLQFTDPITPAPASAISSSVDPTVVLGNITVTPTPASAVASSVNPTVVLGNTTATPAAATAIMHSVLPINWLRDDFEDATIDTSLWDTGNDMIINIGSIDEAVTVAEASGVIKATLLDATSGSHYNGLASRFTYDFTDSEVTTRFGAVPTGSGLAEQWFVVEHNYSGVGRYRLMFWISGANTIYAREESSGYEAAVWSATYNSGLHQYVKIKHHSSDNSVSFYTSGDGITWTERVNHRSISDWPAGTVTEMRVYIVGGTWGSVTTNDPTWHQVNVLPALSITPTAVSAIGSTVDPTVLTGDVTVEPTPVSSITNKVDPTVVLGSTSVTPSSAFGVASSVNPTTVLGSTSVTPTAVSAIGNKADPAVVLGSLNLAPSASSSIVSSVDPTTILGSTTATPVATSAIAVSIDPFVIGGGVIVSPSAINAVASKSDPTVVLSSTTATPTPVNSIASSFDPTVVYGSISLTPSAVSSIATKVDPVVVYGSLTITPTPASAITSTINPLEVFPSPVNAIASVVNPTVVLGDVTIDPTPVGVVGNRAGPTVITGDLIVTPAPISSIASSVDPTVINNVTLIPSPVYTVTYSITNEVFAGEDSYYPDGDDLVGQWLNELNQSTNLWMSIDEVTPDDNDYIKSPEDPGSAIYRATFQDVLDPQTNILHKVKFRYRKNPDAGTTNMKVRLKENTTTVAEWTYTDVSASWTDGEETLSSAQADSIVDYADLLVEIEAY